MSLFRKEAIEAQKNKWLSNVIITSPPSLRVTAVVASVLLILLFLFLACFSYTKKQRINGVIMPDKGVIKIYSPQAGVIKQRYVKEGDVVQAGTALFIISSSKTLSDDKNSQQQISTQIQERLDLLDKTLSSIEGEHKTEEQAVLKQIEQLKLQISLLQKQIANQQRISKLVKDRETQYQQLYKKEYVSLEQLQRISEENLRQMSTLEASKNELVNAQKELFNRQDDLQRLSIKYQKQLNDTESKITLGRQELTESESKREIVVHAPEAGIITATNGRLGQYYDGHAPLVTIIPEHSHLLAYLYAPSHAVGFIQQGAEVWLRYPAFPWQKFGQYRGVVTSISRVSLNSNEIELFDSENTGSHFYQIMVQPDQEYVNVYGKRTPLQVGMQIEADIVRDRRKLYEWIFEPLLKIVPAQTGQSQKSDKK